MTEVLDLPAIEARANAATPGKWGVSTLHVGDGKVVHGVVADTAEVVHTVYHGGGRGTGATASDAEFIAHARTDIPALIARCRELEAKVAGIREDVGPDRDGWYEVHRSYIHDLLDGVEP